MEGKLIYFKNNLNVNIFFYQIYPDIIISTHNQKKLLRHFTFFFFLSFFKLSFQHLLCILHFQPI